MPLAVGSTYDNVFFDYVLDGVRDTIRQEFNNAKVYIAPEIQHADNFQVSIWGPSAATEEWWASSWQKEYQVIINMYLIDKNPNEIFYKHLYAMSERLYQLMHNNRTKSITVGSNTLTWINGTVSEVEINELEDEEQEIDGINKISLSFTCLIEREG